jgi:peptidoglycan-associated lipoprotein
MHSFANSILNNRINNTLQKMMKKYAISLAISVMALSLTACASKTQNPNQKSLDSLSSDAGKNNAKDSQNLQISKITEEESKPIVQTISLAATPQRMGNTPEPRVIYFETDSALLSPSSQEVTKKHASFLANNLANNTPQRVNVQGHTDERGTNEYNLALGQRRAESVKRAMVLLGARAGDIEVTSFGEEKPAVDAQNDAAYDKNRRVEWSYPN